MFRLLRIVQSHIARLAEKHVRVLHENVRLAITCRHISLKSKRILIHAKKIRIRHELHRGRRRYPYIVAEHERRRHDAPHSKMRGLFVQGHARVTA